MVEEKRLLISIKCYGLEMTHNICLQNSLVRTGYTFLPHHKENRKSNPTLCLEGKGGNHKNAANSPTDSHDAFEKHCPAQRDGWTVRGRQEPEGGKGGYRDGPHLGGQPQVNGQDRSQRALGAFLIRTQPKRNLARSDLAANKPALLGGESPTRSHEC